MLKITIPKPCHEDWTAMTLDQQGRHCNACSKTVVDFTSMNDDEVKQFLVNKTNERVCGRFYNDQLQRISIQLPQNIFELKIPFWKHFLAASLVAFSMTLFSCTTTVTGTPLMGDVAIVKEMPKDSVPKRPEHVTMGIVATPRPPIKDTVPKNCTKGEISIQPQKDKAPKTDKPVLMGKVKVKSM